MWIHSRYNYSVHINSSSATFPFLPHLQIPFLHAFFVTTQSISPSHINSPSPTFYCFAHLWVHSPISYQLSITHFHLFAHLQVHPCTSYQLSITCILPFCSLAGSFVPFILYLHHFPVLHSSSLHSCVSILCPVTIHTYCTCDDVHHNPTFTHLYLLFLMLCLDYVIYHILTCPKFSFGALIT